MELEQKKVVERFWIAIFFSCSSRMQGKSLPTEPTCSECEELRRKCTV